MVWKNPVKLRYVVLGFMFMALFASMSFAATDKFRIETSSQIISVEQGEVADFELTIINDYSYSQNIEITADSDVPITVQEGSFKISSHSRETTHIFAMTPGVMPGFYLIEVTIRGKYNTYEAPLGILVEEGEESFSMDSFIGKITVEQSTEAAYKFLIRNDGDDIIKNIIITGNIPTRLSPDYPAMFNLYPDQSTIVNVKLFMPSDYPSGNYDFTIEARTGQLTVSQDVALEVLEKTSLAGALSMELLLPWGPLKEGDRTIGYEIPLRIRNNDVEAVENVFIGFENLPGDWRVEGDTLFSVGALETKDIAIKVIPKDFGEREITLILTHNSERLGAVSLLLAGYKVGVTTTGMFYADGSFTVGILFVVIVVLVLLYVREKNKKANRIGAQNDKKYLKKLVKEAHAEGKELSLPPSMKKPGREMP